MATSFSSKTRFRPGARLGSRYQIVEVLGSGSVGTVVQASDLTLNRESVALKILHPHLVQDEKTFKRFQNEVSIARQLSHPNIVRVFDFDRIEDENLYFIAMESIKGSNLDEYLSEQKNQKICWKDALQILLQITRALSYAHLRGVVHRDIKPANIVLTSQGNAKLGDFGIAKSLEVSHGLTATGEALGTPHYMAPESFSGGSVDAQSDIYSLGILAYRMVVGTPPFDSGNIIKIASQHIQESYPREKLRAAEVPEEYVTFVERCLEKNKQNRFPSTKDILDFFRESPSLSIDKHNLANRVQPKLRSRFFTARFRVLLRTSPILIITLLIGISLAQDKGRVNLLSTIFKFEQHYQQEFPLVKSIFAFSDYSILRRNQFIKAGHDASLGRDQYVILKSLTLAGANIDEKDSEGNSALHIAAKEDRSAFLEHLLMLRPNKSAINQDGDTPLHIAARNSERTVVSFLVSHSASALVKNKRGDNVLHVAARQQNLPALRQLLRIPIFRAYAWVRNDAGETPLHISVTKDDLRSVLLFRRYKLDLNVRDKQGRTPLMLALQNEGANKRQIFRNLLKSGTDVGTFDNSGRSLASYAESNVSKKLLKEALASIP